jgi:hypothetical protein
MTSTIQELLSWTLRPPLTLPGHRTLRDFFLLYAKGKRLKEPDIRELSEVLRANCLHHPGCIGYHDKRDATSKGPALQTQFYYVSATTNSAQQAQAAGGKINPHKHNISISGEHTDYGLRKKMTHVRTFPVMLDNEKIETSYLKETGLLFSYADPQMEYLTGMALMMLQASENYFGPDSAPENNYVFIPYHLGFITGILDANSKIDTRHKLLHAGATQATFNPVAADELKFSIHLNDYLPPERFTRAQQALHDKLIELFPPADSGQFAEAMDAYLLGETTPAGERKSVGLRKMEELMQTPEWFEAVQRTGLNRFRRPSASFTHEHTS